MLFYFVFLIFKKKKVIRKRYKEIIRNFIVIFEKTEI